MMVKSIAALGIVLALFALLVWALKRLQATQMGTSSQHGKLQVIQRISLDSQHNMVEVTRGNSRYILALSQGNVTLIEHLHEHESEEIAKDDSHVV